MIRNNIELDVKIKCLEAGTTQEKLGKTIGTTGQYVNRITKKKDGLLNKTFIKMMEALGYDIELTYVKRNEPTQNIVTQSDSIEKPNTKHGKIPLTKTSLSDLIDSISEDRVEEPDSTEKPKPKHGRIPLI